MLSRGVLDIAEAVVHGLMKVNLENARKVPVVLGVLTCLTEAQAYARAGLSPPNATTNEKNDTPPHNHGFDWAMTAIEMAKLRSTYSSDS